MHILGGVNLRDRTVSKRNLQLNLTSNFVFKKADLPQPKFGHGAAVCGQKIIITSGVSEMVVNMNMRSVPIADVDCQMYDFYENYWEALPDLPIGKMHPAVIVINTRFVFQIGGFDDYDFDIYRLDLRKPHAPWVTLSLDMRYPIIDEQVIVETRSYLLEVSEQDRLRAIR